jgi:hypothetical protein
MTDLTDSEFERISERIKKILALAERGSEHEAAVAAAKASELLQLYNLEVEIISDSAAQADITISGDRYFIEDEEGNLRKDGCREWVMTLSNAIAYVNYCRTIYSPYSVVFIGTKTSIDLCTYMLSNLYHQLQRIAVFETDVYAFTYKLEGKGNAWQAYGSKNARVWKRSWLEGAAYGVASVLVDQRHSFEHINPRALALDHNTQIEDYIRQAYPKLQDVKHVDNTTNWEAESQGIREGKKIHLQHGVETSEVKLLQ